MDSVRRRTRPAAAFAVGLACRGVDAFAHVDRLGRPASWRRRSRLVRRPPGLLARRAGAAPLGAHPCAMLCSVCSYKSAASAAETRRSALPRTITVRRTDPIAISSLSHRPDPRLGLTATPRQTADSTRQPPGKRRAATGAPGRASRRHAHAPAHHGRSCCESSADSASAGPRPPAPSGIHCPSASARSHRDEDDASLCAGERSCSRRNSRIRFAKTPPRDDLSIRCATPSSALRSFAPVGCGRLRSWQSASPIPTVADRSPRESSAPGRLDGEGSRRDVRAFCREQGCVSSCTIAQLP